MMGIGELTVWQWTGAAVAALLVGLSKAGFGAGAGLLAVPLMAAVLGPADMLPVMLLVLITGDI
ncbi:MAG: sulfite exporter TauE/SafE family protein, partial [Candidatus Brocadiae bacterium]|nr:sulfite exporter TauE/SafE family protein [Candidatus Brocadiia bacterium]